MDAKNSLIYLATVKNISKRLEHYGDASIENVSLLKLILTYACYYTKYSTLKRLNSMLMELQRTDRFIPLDIRAEISFIETDEEVLQVDISNKFPSITSFAIAAGEVLVHTFTAGEIYAGWSDPGNYNPANFEITSLPSGSDSTLKYDGQNVSLGTIYSDPTLLTLTTTSGFTTSLDVSFGRKVYNDSELKLPSNFEDITVTFTEIILPNQAPTVEDLMLESVENRSETTITLEMLNSKYSDPENDPIQAIRIDKISVNNQGVFVFSGAAVIIDQVITADDISLGRFRHIGADVNTIATDSIEISVRDTVNGEWVSSD